MNFDSLISMMPEIKKATGASQKYLEGLEPEPMKMQNEFQSKYQDYTEKSQLRTRQIIQ